MRRRSYYVLRRSSTSSAAPSTATTTTTRLRTRNAALVMSMLSSTGEAPLSSHNTSLNSPLQTSARSFYSSTPAALFGGNGSGGLGGSDNNNNNNNNNNQNNNTISNDDASHTSYTDSSSSTAPRVSTRNATATTARRKRRAVIPEDEDMASLHAEDALASGGMGGGGWGSTSSSPLSSSFNGGGNGTSASSAAAAVNTASAMGGLGVPLHAQSIPMYFAPKSSANRSGNSNERDSLFDENDEMEDGDQVGGHVSGRTMKSKSNASVRPLEDHLIGEGMEGYDAQRQERYDMEGANREYENPMEDADAWPAAGINRSRTGASNPTMSSGESASVLSRELFLDERVAMIVVERQRSLLEAPLPELLSLVCAYLRSTENTRIVSAEEEHILFPVLMDRMNECSILQLLEVVECHWARSTLVRYGSHFKDLVRDRIAVVATEAAKQREEKRTSALHASMDDGEDGLGGAESGVSPSGNEIHNQNNNNNDNDDGGDESFGNHSDAPKGAAHDNFGNPEGVDEMGAADDVILQRAMEEMNPDTVLRCIVVMGMSAGRRKRDLEFFQVLGAYFVLHINHYKNPRDLVHVLTAFSRAKIVPSNAFLGLIGRRLAVLNKKAPLGALPSYRAFVNLYKMGFDQMTPFRFLADRIFETVDQNVKLEKKQKRMRELRAAKAGKTQPESSEKETLETPIASSAAIPVLPVPETLSIRNALAGDVMQSMHSSEAARQRFQLITELKPQMFTKLLLVLTRFGAPHQQYLRPVIEPLLLPTFRHFSPPSFARLLRVLRLFRTTDRSILEPVVDFMADDLGPRRVLLNDLLEMLAVMAHPDVPMLRNFDKMILLCHDVFQDRVGLRPGEMCVVASQLFAIQRKDEVPLEATEALTQVMDSFANRMCDLMDLNVLSLTHAEVLVDVCRRMQHPDEHGAVERLSKKRHAVNASEESDDGYYSALDIDVRELFHKVQFVNSFNTFGSFRPTPGALQVDFKQALTEVSVEVVLEAAHLHHLAFPNCMIPTVSRHMSRSILAKLAKDGEEVVTPENTIEIRPTQPVFMTNEGLERFAALLRCSPLTRARNSADAWTFVRLKAEVLKNPSIQEMAEAEIQRIVSRRNHASTTDSGSAESNSDTVRPIRERQIEAEEA